MSWSVNYFGKPEAISAKLDEYESTLTGESLTEFKEAKPSLQALLALNVGNQTLTQLNANGHASFQNGQKQYGTCAVGLSVIYGSVV